MYKRINTNPCKGLELSSLFSDLDTHCRACLSYRDIVVVSLPQIPICNYNTRIQPLEDGLEQLLKSLYNEPERDWGVSSSFDDLPSSQQEDGSTDEEPFQWSSPELEQAPEVLQPSEELQLDDPLLLWDESPMAEEATPSDVHWVFTDCDGEEWVLIN